MFENIYPMLPKITLCSSIYDNMISDIYTILYAKTDAVQRFRVFTPPNQVALETPSVQDDSVGILVYFPADSRVALLASTP